MAESMNKLVFERKGLPNAERFNVLREFVKSNPDERVLGLSFIQKGDRAFFRFPGSDKDIPFTKDSMAVIDSYKSLYDSGTLPRIRPDTIEGIQANLGAAEHVVDHAPVAPAGPGGAASAELVEQKVTEMRNALEKILFRRDISADQRFGVVQEYLDSKPGSKLESNGLTFLKKDDKIFFRFPGSKEELPFSPRASVIIDKYKEQYDAHEGNVEVDKLQVQGIKKLLSEPEKSTVDVAAAVEPGPKIPLRKVIRPPSAEEPTVEAPAAIPDKLKKLGGIVRSWGSGENKGYSRIVSDVGIDGNKSINWFMLYDKDAKVNGFSFDDATRGNIASIVPDAAVMLMVKEGVTPPIEEVAWVNARSAILLEKGLKSLQENRAIGPDEIAAAKAQIESLKKVAAEQSPGVFTWEKSKKST
ncbi:MAG: hypothetical protein UY81_C0007G0010 [Candidatus Giovannonibacteria bacterium GW2011_GWA2_53_7]|uniref:Uncharacterized protein n=1 Tax=Candidatus Giovannonibacteria bacterium GW2011_GWA2_53_7 TaxID=1618650 RepID=A0A0G2AVQ2_9BACT|nr:MAG: hypothetical protein UY81_C0007G0010 [Candidatus Giovannonibacteria bacterium GW2011_GWA2_53_7]